MLAAAGPYCTSSMAEQFFSSSRFLQFMETKLSLQCSWQHRPTLLHAGTVGTHKITPMQVIVDKDILDVECAP
jgi:hypothetical protein